VTVRSGYAKNREARSVLMNDTLTVLLKSGKLQAAEEEQVLCARHGQPCRLLQTALEQAVRSAGFRDFTFHDPRHTFTTRLVIVGVGLPTVTELLGKRDFALTLHCVALSDDSKRAASEKPGTVPAIFTTPLNARRSKDAQVVEN
jgi:integrase